MSVEASLTATLEDFFLKRVPIARGDLVLVAFSGGSDSTALLLGLRTLGPRLGLRLHAAHVDHGLDDGSPRRAEAAGELAERLQIPFSGERCSIRRYRTSGESLEAAARRLRYAYLDRLRSRLGARYIATGHHQDDQAETVLLRILFGSGVEGLAGIRPRFGRVVRPLLGVPRSRLLASLEQAGIEALEDPTNRDLAVPRNRLRHTVLPALVRQDPQIRTRLADLATRAGAARTRVSDWLARHLTPECRQGGWAIRRDAFRALPASLKPFALALLHRRAEIPYPAGQAAREELLRQMAGGGRVGCDCGGEWRWEERGEHLLLCPKRAPAGLFTYTLQVPGELEIQEIPVLFRMSRRAVAPWMFRDSPHRAAMALPVEPGDTVTIRNRRPGDRFQPLGCPEPRRLKGVLINRQVPRAERDWLPLLCAQGRIAWVPGVEIDERWRLVGEKVAWVAELVHK